MLDFPNLTLIHNFESLNLSLKNRKKHSDCRIHNFAVTQHFAILILILKLLDYQIHTTLEIQHHSFGFVNPSCN